MAVLLTPFFLQFEDENGVPVRNGRVWTYAAGTTTPKATYTDFTEQFQLPNPVPLDAAGRATIWINGFYKFVLEDADGVVIRTTDNVSSFIAGATEGEPPFYQQLSGDGTQTVFTLLEDLGTDSGALFVFVNNGTDAGYEIQYPTSYEINGTELTFNTPPSAGVNNIYVFAPVRLLTAAAASASEAASSANAAALSAIDANDAKLAAEAAQLAAESAQQAAETAETNAETAEDNAADSALLAQEWAVKDDGQVASTDYSAKAWAIGGTGTETNNAKYWADQALLRSGFVWRGVWVAGTYTVNEAVEHNGSSWIALATTSEEPSLIADDWDLLALKGADGEGLTDGDKGDLTVTGTGTVWTINNGAVSTAELGGDITAAGKALLDDASPADQRTTLGLGTAAVEDVGTAAGNVVQLDGSGRLPAVDGSQLTGLNVGAAPQVDIFTSSGTYNTPAGAKYLEITEVGGGGGGGGSSGSPGAGSGGGGGFVRRILTGSLSSSYTVTVGAGGSAGGGGVGGGGGGYSQFGSDSSLGAGGGGGGGGGGSSTTGGGGGGGGSTPVAGANGSNSTGAPGGSGGNGGGVGAGAGVVSGGVGNPGSGSSGGGPNFGGGSAGGLPNSTNTGSGGRGGSSGSSGYVMVVAHF